MQPYKLNNSEMYAWHVCNFLFLVWNVWKYICCIFMS